MEGYLWKRGRKVPSMKRKYAVLKGTMLSFYVTQDEAQRPGVIPKRVVEITDLRIMPAASSSETTHLPLIVLDYFDAKGGGTLSCRAASKEMQQVWLASLQHALDEPNRMAEEEIAEVQEEIHRDTERHSQAVQQAIEAVEAAGRHHREQAHAEVTLQQNRGIARKLSTELESAKVLHLEAKDTVQTLQLTLEDEKQSKRLNSEQEKELTVAKMEVAASAESTYGRKVEWLQAEIERNSKEHLDLVERVQTCAEESKHFRQVATMSLEDAQLTKQRTKRLASWDEDTASTRHSHLDPLAKGYLLCQHPLRTTMHRRYYVLTGNTLCWYADQDAYEHKMDAPNGVLHVAEVFEWDGRVKPTSPMRRLVVPFSSSSKARFTEQCSNPFAVLTVEGKTLRCSAPLAKDQEEWIAALHIGLTMPPLSPHRARAAKARRDSFDLLASTPPSPNRQNSEKTPKEEAKVAETTDTGVASSDDSTLKVVVEGYLVLTLSQDVILKKQYCQLRALTLYTFATHQEASKENNVFDITGVSKWNGHTSLLQYDHAFLLHSGQHQSIYCSAPDIKDQKHWIHSVQRAIVQYQHQGRRDYELSMQIAATEPDEVFTEKVSDVSAQNDLLVVLQRYYSEHHPSKLNDVPMLLSRYKGREQALVEHLNRLYGTSMGIDTNVQKNPAVSLPSPPALLPKRAPASPMPCSGDHSDWLTWNNETSPRFCILIENRLECFESVAQSRVETPSTVFVVTDLHDYPVPSPMRSGTRHETKELQFFISGGNEPLTSSTELQVLQATSSEAKQTWIAKLQRALTSISSVSKSKSPSDISLCLQPTQGATLQEKVLTYYERYNPTRVHNVDQMLTSFAGRERQLLWALDATYGTNVSLDPTFATLLPPMDQSSAVNYREGYLTVKHPLLGPSPRKCFCVLNGTNWQCFNSIHSHIALMSDVVVSVHPVTTKLAEQLAFHLETQTNGVILLHADAVEIVHDWMQVLRTVVASHSSVDNGMKQSTKDEVSAYDQLRTRLVTFLDTYNPSKVSEVDALLQSFEGREGALLEQIDTVYKSELSSDPVCTSLCANLAANFAEKHHDLLPSKLSEVSSDENILMEGYLMKRGHKIPSMRKRYCVLKRNELSYYVTHDDSKNPSSGATTNPLGFFRVEIVGDWHGKTATHTYEHAMELETTDGKTFFCAASTATEKQQWVNAFRRGIALVQSQERRASDNASETEHDRRLRDQFRTKLADFYRVRNPAKLSDLDLLLSCYVHREVALLQAIDQAYGTELAADESILCLLPPHPEQATALATLQLDGYLKKTSSSKSNALWNWAQTVYVAVDEVIMTLHATREGFKSRKTEVREGMIVLAVKEEDSANTRFAVETSDHEWLHFEARDVMEKRLWLQVLRAALDTVLAQTFLADEQRLNAPSGSLSDKQGFLLLRMDFDRSQEDHWKQKEVATSIEECSVTLENGHTIHIRQLTKGEEEQARFRVSNTRAWTPGARSWPVTAGHRAPRFPFQIVTLEQFVLSCSAATDAERAKWIRHLRNGAEQAAALERIEDQLLDIEAPLSPGRQSLLEKQSQVVSNRQIDVSPQEAVVARQHPNDEPPITGYLSIRLANSSLLSEKLDETQMYFLVLDTRGHVAVYSDENSYYRQDAPCCEGQAIELLTDGLSSPFASTRSPKTTSMLKQFSSERNNALSSSSMAFAVTLRLLKISNDSTGRDSRDEFTTTLEIFFTLRSQREQWMEAFANGIEYIKGEALLKNDRILRSLEQDEHEIIKDRATSSNSDSNSGDDDGNTDDRGFEAKAVTLARPEAVEDANGVTPLAFVVKTAAMEGMLTPWQTSGSPIRIPGSSKMKATPSVYAILIGCRLQCYSSHEAAVAATNNGTLALSDQRPALELEITTCSSWEAPSTSWLTTIKESENLGLQIGVKGSRHTSCFTAPTVEAKHQWIQVMHHELHYDIAERSLSFSERQFTHEVAAHFAAAIEGESEKKSDTATVVALFQEHVRVRHHNLGSIWRERFVVLDNSTLTIFPESCNVDDWKQGRLSTLAVEKHEVVGVENWHPVFTSLGRNGPGLRGSGFRIETTSGVYLEVVTKTPESASQWKSAITAATTKETTSSFTSRDATLPFIPGARMEGYLKLKDGHDLKDKGIKMKSLEHWKSRYCVVMGSHWLVYATQAQAVSSGEAPTPVAVYELLGIAVATKDNDISTNKFSIHVVSGKVVKCRARSSLERKRWVNAIEDELLVYAKTSESVENSMKEHETKVAARNAVKTKLHEVKTDARRLSMLLGEAIKSASGDLSSSDDDVSLDDESLSRERLRPDYIDGSPESSPMRRNGEDAVFFSDRLAVTKDSEPKESEAAPSILSFFARCFQCLPTILTEPIGRNVVAPLGLSGYPSTAAACNPLYTCEYYEDDGYRGCNQ